MADEDVPAIISPYLPRGDVIIFGDKDSGKTALTLCAILARGYKFGHVVFCCPHVHRTPRQIEVAEDQQRRKVQDLGGQAKRIAGRDGDRRS